MLSCAVARDPTMSANPERTQSTPPSAREAGTLHDKFRNLWNGFPSDAKARVALDLVQEVLAGENGRFVRDVLLSQLGKETKQTGNLLGGLTVKRSDLLQTSLSEGMVATLTDEDLDRIAAKMREHYYREVFWDELEYFALDILDNEE